MAFVLGDVYCKKIRQLTGFIHSKAQTKCVNPVVACFNITSYPRRAKILVQLSAIFKACVRFYFSLFLKDKCISLLFLRKYIKKKFNLVVFSSHCFMIIHSCLSYHGLPTFLELLDLKNKLHE